MSSDSSKPTFKQRWTPLEEAVPGEKIAKAMRPGDRIFKNKTHTVIVYPHNTHHGLPDPMDGWVILSIRRNDRAPECDWRIMMRIKNELTGAEREAIQLFPGLRRVVDTANQYFLFVAPKGYVLGVGQMEQEVSGAEFAEKVGAKQRPFDSDDPLCRLVNNSPRTDLCQIFPMPLYPEEVLTHMTGRGKWQWVPNQQESSDGDQGRDSQSV